MAKPVKDAKLKAQTIWPGATVSARGKGSIKHQHPTNPNRFMVDTQVGGRGWHFGDGPFTEVNEVDTAWVDAHPIDDAPWQKKMVLADYNAYAFREPTHQFDQGQLIEYVHPASGEAVNFQPTQLQWTNDLDQISPIADPQAVSATIDDDMLTWADAYGSGIDFQWETQTARLAKYVNIDTLANLGSPPQFIIDGGNPVLRVELLFQKSANTEIWVDDVLWDEKTNNPQETLNNVEFRLAGVPLWWFKAPKAWDSGTAENSVISPLLRIRKSGPNLFVEILTPWSWLETATYPVTVDAPVDEQVAGSDDDANHAGDDSFDATNVFIRMEERSNPGAWDYFCGGARFTVAVDQGVTIDTAYQEMYNQDRTGENDPNQTIYANDVDDAVDFSAGGDQDIITRVRTTAGVLWEDSNLATTTWHGSGLEIKSVISEIITDRGGWASGQGLVLLYISGSGNQDDWWPDSYDRSSSNAPKLHIEYEAAGTDVDVPLATLVITGKVPTPTATANVDIDVPLATLVITGNIPTVATPRNVPVPVGTLVITGYVPTVAATANVNIDVPLASLVITGLVPSVGWSGGATVPLATLVITGLVPSPGWSGSADIPVATLVITGYVPGVDVSAATNIDVPLATLVITGLVPDVGWSGSALVPVATLVITGHIPEVVGIAGTNIPVPLATLVITGKIPTVGWSGSANIPLANLVITGLVPTAGWTGGAIVPLATLEITTYVPSIATPRDVPVPLATLVITGLVPTVVAGGGADILIPLALLIITGYSPIPVGIVTKEQIGAFPQVTVPVGPPPVDRSFPVDKFYSALDNEAQKMRVVVNQAYEEAEQKAEELKRQARYARDEALDAIYNDLRQVNLRMEELGQAKTDIRSMQMRRRLEDARNKKPEPEQKPKKRKDRTPKLTKLKKKQYKKRR
jgi:hypothetical protein